MPLNSLKPLLDGKVEVFVFPCFSLYFLPFLVAPFLFELHESTLLLVREVILITMRSRLHASSHLARIVIAGGFFLDTVIMGLLGVLFEESIPSYLHMGPKLPPCQ